MAEQRTRARAIAGILWDLANTEGVLPLSHVQAAVRTYNGEALPLREGEPITFHAFRFPDWSTLTFNTMVPLRYAVAYYDRAPLEPFSADVCDEECPCYDCRERRGED